MKTLLETAIQLAGVLQFITAAANFFLPSKLDYAGNLSKVSPVIRQIFVIHCIYIVFVLVGFGGICILFPQDLCGSSSIGKYLCAFFALFWGVRMILQFKCYDVAVKRAHPIGSIFFAGVFAYLSLTFIAATFLSL
jgi:hypothetical protein